VAVGPVKSLARARRQEQAVFTATGLNRQLTVHGDGMVTVKVTFWTWWTMGARRRDGRPRQVDFPLWAIRAGSLRTAVRLWPGLLVLDVPAANDPWGRRTDKMREKREFPHLRRHKLRFTRQQQPWFVYAAEQIGVENPNHTED
jgi:hypothetical protein